MRTARSARGFSQGHALFKEAFPMVLKRGSSGLEVKILQEQLNKIGVGCDVDGIYGPGTEKAVKTFQTAYAIDSDGIVGEATRIKLQEALEQAGGGSAA